MSNEKVATANYRCRTCRDEFSKDIGENEIPSPLYIKTWMTSARNQLATHYCSNYESSYQVSGLGDLINVYTKRLGS